MRRFWIACALVAALAPCALAQTRAAAVVDDGYAGNALNKIMEKYKAPTGGQRQDAKLFLDADGRLLDCRALKGDVKALCQAARAASPFGEPPYGVPTSIVLAVWSGKSAQAPMAKPERGRQSANVDAKYLAKIRRELRDSMYIPEKTKPGTYHVTARVKCDAQGKILDGSILKSSGDSLLDRYVLQGIRRAGSISAPPAGAGESFDVNFTLKR